ncbi:FAD-binding domain-containing protein [Durotheca rogersii]|uniref:FAD-binding domain-containing protein n=1 Tax=Durotheca rogersii TaxID=419775 RepID=UPI0022200FDD|nr:FAD-binding domain-containing protein [Durotheca rogersii]KAI5862012.1 FAD-binding domain-containing protein [Durotheca rogersii]
MLGSNLARAVFKGWSVVWLTAHAVSASPTPFSHGDHSLFDTRSSNCRTLPGDADWPSQADWARLNRTVGGRLIATVPLASACHDPTYDAARCDKLKETWLSSAAHVYDPAEIINPYFQGNTCSPFTPREQPCLLGNYASYSINVSSISDIRAGLQFAKSKNVRLVIKNTGHDLLGKSTGAGSLSLWTQHLKTVEFIDSYKGDLDYNGTAIRLGAGVKFNEVLPEANRRGVRLVTGTCATVGGAGGYTSGGGHGSLTSQYGMAADSVLEWEVVTVDGEHLVATPKRNADLYWALSGGGAGTFAVVLSMTTRTYAETPMQLASFSFGASDAAFAGDVDAFWRAVNAFHASLGPVTDAGAVVTYFIRDSRLYVFAAVIPGADVSAVAATLEPVVTALEGVGVALNTSSAAFGSYYDLYRTTFVPVELATESGQLSGGRLVPRAVVESASGVAALGEAFRGANEAHFEVACGAVNANTRQAPTPANAVLPAWRETLLTCIIIKFWDFDVSWAQNLEYQARLTREVMPRIQAASPGGAAYLNEANFEEPDWQTTFYGPNYPRLRRIKAKYDPQGLLYARTAVGSEAWREDTQGRLCRV